MPLSAEYLSAVAAWRADTRSVDAAYAYLATVSAAQAAIDVGLCSREAAESLLLSARTAAVTAEVQARASYALCETLRP